MDLIFLILSFLAALSAVVTFGLGLIEYIMRRNHAKYWQWAIMMVTSAAVLAFMAALMASDMTLRTGFIVVGIYLILAVIGIITVHIIKQSRGEETKGYLKLIGILLTTASATFAIAFLVVDSSESPIREINETFGAEEGDSRSGERIPVTIASFVDGDTTRFNYNGEDASFRYLLIDTPETNHPRLGMQPFGSEASTRTKALLSEASTIEVEFDDGPKQDHYGRYLAYIYADGEMINEVLVREGLAQVRYINPPNTKYLKQLESAQAEAEAAGLGIWSLDHPYNSDAYQSGSSDDPGEEVEDFANCTELRAVYPRGVEAAHPAYQLKMDGNRNGHACE
ncbi:thermonuclease family protein [Salinicoccus sesuvii]|uniref:Thermonuclease family protein n=1 Tax=Salinicoccus sesuvii TaxID=868281 RepID=A0ABV7N589_9STAP